MAQFHETVGGRKFYDADVPRLLKLLESIAKSTEMLAKATEKKASRPDPEKKNGESICCDETDCAERENKEEAWSLAIQQYAKDGEIEIDDDAEVSLSLAEDGNAQGAYVQAWVYVEFTANKETP
jgi:hypothetical protein